jgi:RNA polymerase sigma-70 factor (ECF subfamily)
VTSDAVARLRAAGVTAGSEALERRWSALEAAVRAEHPSLALDAAAFAEHVASVLPVGSPERELATLDALAGPDLALAWGCLAGDRAALAVFEARFVPKLERALAGLRMPAADEQEVLADLRADLLVGERPRLAQYRGRGRLGAWLRVTATRAGLMKLRGARREQPDEELVARASAGDEPQLAHLKAVYREAFSDAFGAAVRALEAKDRNLLRFHYLDGLGTDEIGLIYGCHRTTVNRWLVATRKKLLVDTRKRLAGALGVGRGELDSIMRLIRSRFELDLSDLLRTREPVEDDRGGA